MCRMEIAEIDHEHTVGDGNYEIGITLTVSKPQVIDLGPMLLKTFKEIEKAEQEINGNRIPLYAVNRKECVFFVNAGGDGSRTQLIFVGKPRKYVPSIENEDDEIEQRLESYKRCLSETKKNSKVD
ncbi:MAG: hypothetical protein NTZ73_01595 [Candidatus Diapherotrites archaeon]|nr:hypothetical protein [Candidatus Diapherotrites archaeon]